MPPARKNVLEMRQKKELDEFSDPIYAWLVQSVAPVSQSTIDVTLRDGRTIRVERTQQFLREAPRAYTGAGFTEEIRPEYADQWGPAVTTIRWLMMLLYITPDPC